MAVEDPGQLDIGTSIRPARGFRAGGDRALALPGQGFWLLAIVDVLGHGPQADQLAGQIETYLRNNVGSEPLDLIGKLHRLLQGSRGAVAGLACYEPPTRRLRFVGVGNAVARILGPRHRHLLTKEGVLGETLRSPREESVQLEVDDLLLMYSDGIASHFEPTDYRQIYVDPAETIARQVIQRYGKLHDDASCIAMRPQP